jgi:hypothetical protein
MSEYNKLKNSGLKRGRPKLSEEERILRKHMNSTRQEARRRTHLVLQHRHQDEYDEIFEQEFKSLIKKGY